MKPSKTLAFLAYLVLILGWIYVLLFHRKDRFAVFHAKQAMMLTVAASVAPVAWAVIAWFLTWIPLFGPVVAAALFALVIALYIGLVALWIVGMVNALHAEMKPLPVVGDWAEWFPIGS